MPKQKSLLVEKKSDKDEKDILEQENKVTDSSKRKRSQIQIRFMINDSRSLYKKVE